MFRETFRVLKPGGCFIFSVWDRADRNPLVEVVQQALLSLFPEEIVRSNLVPFSYHEPEVIRADLAAAGFVKSELEAVIGHSQSPSARTVAIAQCSGQHPAPQDRGLRPGVA